jgi:hypothetical protein
MNEEEPRRCQTCGAILDPVIEWARCRWCSELDRQDSLEREAERRT